MEHQHSRRNRLLELSDKYIDRRILTRHCELHYNADEYLVTVSQLRVCIAACFFDVYRLDQKFLAQHEISFFKRLNSILGYETSMNLFRAKYLQTA